MDQIGPVLPPNFLQSTNDDEADKKTEAPAYEGPALPPHLLNKQSQEKVFGPALPSNFQKSINEDNNSSNESSEDEGTIGPLPQSSSKLTSAQIALEERALQMKLGSLNDSSKKEPSREEWMLELPEVKAGNLGLGPRQFRSKTGPDMSDRSSWTDTPKTKGKKPENQADVLKREAERKNVQDRDKEQEAMAKKHKRKKESLVEIHQKKLKSEKQKTGTEERKPFNRETDLQVNKFDEAQKKAVLKKAQLLDTRFAAGNSKFL